MTHPLVVDKKVNSYDINIMRPSKWGNPYPLQQFESREECLLAFKWYLLRSPDLLASLHELTGKVLGCCCAPRACHGDILARMANNPMTVKAYAKTTR